MNDLHKTERATPFRVDIHNFASIWYDYIICCIVRIVLQFFRLHSLHLLPHPINNPHGCSNSRVNNVTIPLLLSTWLLKNTTLKKFSLGWVIASHILWLTCPSTNSDYITINSSTKVWVIFIRTEWVKLSGSRMEMECRYCCCI